MVTSHKYTKLVQLCINPNVQRCSPLPTKFNFDFILTLAQLLYHKILKIMNTFDNIKHVKVSHTWHIVHKFNIHISIQLDLKRKSILQVSDTERYFQVIMAHAVLSDLYFQHF